MGASGTEITVYKDRLQRFLADTPVCRKVAAGYVLAHELAHVMQGVARHSESGIMKARWAREDCDAMASHQLAFTQSDVELIHQGLAEQRPAGDPSQQLWWRGSARWSSTSAKDSTLASVNATAGNRSRTAIMPPWRGLFPTVLRLSRKPAPANRNFSAKWSRCWPTKARPTSFWKVRPGTKSHFRGRTVTLTPGALSAGAISAEYRVAGKIGSGGMGEVYRATDTKLQREVALKVLAPEFAANSEWMCRFQSEARLLASLNHPNIAAVYGLEESGGVRAIAMELVEGPTLAQRMARGHVPISEAVAIARQIAEALEYAHEKGIVHRDLKPANVSLRPDGVVKVLDFGLAKAIDPKDEPTVSHAGGIVGTPAYMAPEQAAGLPVDRRADIWAFGVVLFEMLAGRQAYARKTTLETLVAVARDDPRWEELPAGTPADICRMLRRCLDRDPKLRLRDIGEARIAFEAASQPVEPGHVLQTSISIRLDHHSGIRSCAWSSGFHPLARSATPASTPQISDQSARRRSGRFQAISRWSIPCNRYGSVDLAQSLDPITR